VKAELRAITKSHGSRAMAVVISSTIPSTKYSCSASPVMFSNGKTASDGLSGEPAPSANALSTYACSRVTGATKV
jgi:hypothetical protein